ncbi:MAG: MFS transporter [Chloroflexi bacterium]|nr:MFS transporter [Chloroflexota bacterium]
MVAGPRRFSALRNRNFALLWAGLLISNSGSWMQIVAQGWLVYTLTDSPFYLGLVGFSRAIPMIALPPMGGVIADRVPRLKLLKVTQSLSLLVACVLATLIALDVVQVWQVILCSFLSGAVNAFDQPTRQALLPDLVQREDMTNAIALNSAAWQGSALFGPSLAGATVAVIGVAGAFYANAASFLAVVVALFLMRNVPERSTGRPERGLFDDLKAGLGYVRATRLVWTLLLLSALTSIFGRSYVQLLPVFARDVLHEGTGGLGLMMSAPGAGTLVGATLLGALGDVERKGVVLFAGMLTFSATLVLFTLSRSFALTFGLLFLAGLTSIIFSTMMTTMLQLTAPAHMRGRVMSLVTVTMQGFAPLGALLTGSVATAIGTPPAVALSSLCVTAAALVAAAGAEGVRAYVAPEDGPAAEPVRPSPRAAST